MDESRRERIDRCLGPAWSGADAVATRDRRGITVAYDQLGGARNDLGRLEGVDDEQVKYVEQKVQAKINEVRQQLPSSMDNKSVVASLEQLVFAIKAARGGHA